MATEITCPNGHRLRVARARPGATVRCPKCDSTFRLPAAGEAPAGSAPAEPETLDDLMPVETEPPALRSYAPPESSPSSAAPSRSAPFARRTSMSNSSKASEFLMGYQALAYPLILVGLILVLTGKGCVNLSNLNVSASHAKLQLAQSEFNTRWDEKMKKATPQDRSKLMEDRNKERQSLDEGDWQSLTAAARDASANAAVSGWWFELMFVIGSIVLTLSLAVIGVTGEGAERWLCLIMLALIVFSLYIGGMAWMGSVGNMMRSVAGPGLGG
jgi:hypothetical protein